MQIWKIRAGRSGKYWESWKKNSIITIGWDVGDLRDLNWEETKEILEEKYPDSSPGITAGQMRTVAGVREEDEKNVKVGDIVVVLGEATVLGIANVVGEYKYVKDGIEENKTHTYQRYVEYLFEGPVRIRDLPERFRLGGEYSLHLVSTINEFGNASEEVINELLEILKELEKVSGEETFIEFSEGSLQDYIERNYKELNEDIVELEGEYPTPVGNADFRCETKNGEILVIETKIGTANDSAVGQILGYMNAIRQDLKGQKVRGLIIAEGFTERVKSAVKSDDLRIKKFYAKLEFQDLSPSKVQ